jgi:hypothetical protein
MDDLTLIETLGQVSSSEAGSITPPTVVEMLWSNVARPNDA